MNSIRLSVFLAASSAAVVVAQVNNPSAAERFRKPDPSLVDEENRYWKRIPLAVPDSIVLEVSGIVATPDRRLLVTTRRGEIWWIEGAYDAEARPRFSLFASGLHEPLGIVPAAAGGYYVAQRQELTRVADADNDGRADVFETVCKLPISGSYHEYAFGPVVAPNGNLRLTLNVAFGGSTQAPVPWRGWMVEITPQGKLIPIAAGLRSPAGFMVTSGGQWFYSDNQGEWVGSGKMTEVEVGDFTGHPAGLAWSHLPGSPVSLRRDDIRSFGEPMHDVARRLPGVKPPAVWFPHTILGISTAGMLEDRSGGLFGPFAGQFFVADQGQSKIMRMSLEKVRGVWQGAAYSFRSGFDSGILRLAQGPDGSLFAGETERGWGALGTKSAGLERVVWTGQVPFEIREVRAQPDGFLLTFTQPVDRAAAADPANYTLTGFTYLWHQQYGSASVNRMLCPVRKAVVSPDGLSVRLAAICLREGYVHEIRAAGLKSSAGAPLLHPSAYYTLNRLAEGPRIIPVEPGEAELCASTVPPAAAINSPKHPIQQPSDWPSEGDRALVLGTLPGLKFDATLIEVKAGERLRFAFRNTDDMLHNFVLCAPGRGQAVGEAAMALGLDGPARNYVPDTPDVIVHSSLVLPGGSDTLYFEAPSKPGDYDFICSFPGHATLMKGVLRVASR